MSEKYEWEVWIDTGRTHGQYTLHRDLIEKTPEMWAAFRSTYIQNVGRTWDRACAAADKYCDQVDSGASGKVLRKYHIGDELGSLRKPGVYDCRYIWFGKYDGCLFENVIRDDPEYLMFIRDNFDYEDSKPRMKSLIDQIRDLNLGESRVERERREQQEKIDAANKKRDSLLKNTPAIEAGRRELTVRLISVKSQDGMYGPVLKFLGEEDNGNRYWGTLPSEVNWLGSDIRVMQPKITIRGTIDVAKDDNHFAFIKRPHLIDQEQPPKGG